MNKPSRITMIAGAGGLLILLALVAARVFFIGYHRIPQNGMYPGLPAGSLVFSAKRAYPNPSSVKRGDIIVFIHEEKGTRYHYIWRVIGLPGESVQTSGNSLVINGREVQRERVREAYGMTIFREQIGRVSYEVAFDPAPRYPPPDVSLTVPPDAFFVMGDNRANARDSRYLGVIPFRSVIGKKL
jgi:signal peptidase I